MELTRRGFFKSNAVTAVAAAGLTHDGPKTPFLLGRWMIASSDLHFKDSKTAFFRAMAHESPEIKFPRGTPERGDPVRVNLTWDTCSNRGQDKHRTLLKRVLRVYLLADSLRNDAEIRLLDFCPDEIEGWKHYPVSLHRHNTHYLVRGQSGIAPVRPDYSQPIQPAEEFPTPAWQTDLDEPCQS